MKTIQKIGVLAVFLVFFLFKLNAQDCVTSGPIISEWAVGIGGDLNASFIEIYNGTGTDLDMADYFIITSVNGEWLQDTSLASFSTKRFNDFCLTGEYPSGSQTPVVLAPGEIFIFCNDSAYKYLDTLVPDLGDNVYVRKSNWTAHINTFNGNDPKKAFLYLAKNEWLLPALDVIGTPGGNWGGLKKDLRRDSLVLDPASTYDVTQWESHSGADVAVLSEIGKHTIICTSEIEVKTEEGTVLNSEDDVDAGTIFIPNSVEATFTISNLGGNKALELETPAAQVSAGISLTADAGQKTLQIGESTTIIISIAPDATGAFTGTVTIPANDININPFVINILADVKDPYIDPPIVTTDELNVYEGADVEVEFTSYGTFTGDFEIQLSDASGDFSTPTVIGTLATGAEGVKNHTANVLTDTPVGTGYRIRIYNSDADIASEDNGADIVIINEEPEGIGSKNMSAKLNIYPNPANVVLNISFGANDLSTLRLIGLTGIIHSEYQFEKNTSIDISDLPKGVYILSVHTEEEKLYRKVIIQ